jgi:DNA invertase Pin-like site-specific DNA recombinase
MRAKIMYQRISTRSQNLTRQEVMAADFGIDKVFVDVMSGKDTKRPQLEEMLAYVRAGDVLIIESFSRLGRSLRDLLDIIEHLEKKNVILQSQKEGVCTDSASGRLQVALFAALSQFEHDIMLERQAEGVAAAKAAGKYTGGVKKPTDWDCFKSIHSQWRAGKLTAVAAQKMMGMTAPTWYRRVKEWEVSVNPKRTDSTGENH